MRLNLFIAVASISTILANPSYARMPGCTKAQELSIVTAIADAKRLAVTAAAAVGDTIEYERWFGKFSPSNAERVRANLKSIASAIRTGSVTAQCDPVGYESCDSGTYAFVFPDEPYLIHLCPNFFRQPVMAQLRPGTNRSDNGTRSGTIIHEISHFTNVARTEDECYSRSECDVMATRSAQRAIQNADSYQYFVEDVTHFANERALIEAATSEQEN